MRRWIFAVFSVILIAFSANATVNDGHVTTTVGYVTHELDTRQDEFPAQSGTKAMTFGDDAGEIGAREVKSDLGSNTSDDSLPTVSAVNDGLDDKQDAVPANNTNTVLTYTGTAGNVGAKGIYQNSGTYANQMDNLVTAGTFNTALRNGLESEFVCVEYDPAEPDKCWLWAINDRNEHPVLPSGYTRLEYITGTGTQKMEIPVSGFDTGDWSVYAKWMITGSSAKDYPCIFCSSIENSNSQQYAVQLHSSYNMIYYITRGGKPSNCYAVIYNKPANQVHYATIGKLSGSFDGHNASRCTLIGTRIPNTTFSFFDGINGRLYAANIQKDSVMQYNLVPASRNSDNAVGMYDTINGQFLVSVGTDAFIAGPIADIHLPQNQ